MAILRLLPSLALAASLGLALALPTNAAAQCRTPGQTCGIFGGSCCSGSSCVIGVCVANCAGDGGLCLSSSGCCGERVCALGFCQTPRSLGQACGPGFPCRSGLSCDPLSGFVCIGNADLGEACGPFVQCNPGLSCDPLAGFRCIANADLGEACGPAVACNPGLVCDPLAGFVCVDQSVGPGQACGPLVQCDAGLVCDPLAGFRCVPATTPGLGQACGPLFPCGDGLVCDPLAGFVCVDRSVGAGIACGPLVQCEEGLFCDPLAGFRCVSAAGVDQACGPVVACEVGLQCTAAFRCAHAPARAGETCGLGTGCEEGLYCQLGLPSRCRELKKPGEGCSAFHPCVAEASCQPCLVDGCSAPLQCFPNDHQGILSEQTCRTLHSPGLAKASQDIDLAMTYGIGNEGAALLGEAQAIGVAYGQDGTFGCYTTLCGGINADVGIETFASVGFYLDFGSVGGSSFANVQEAQLPGNLLNFSTSQVFARDPGELLPSSPVTRIGTEDTFSVGVGPNVLPFSAASLLCETVLDTVIAPGMPDAPAALAVAPPVLPNPGFAVDLAGWGCIGAGACARVDDDPTASEGAGAGEVASPPPGASPGVAYLASGCTAVAPGQPYRITAWGKTSGARPGVLLASWNAGLDCDGPLVAQQALGVSPPDATWRRLAARRRAPAGAQSVQLLLSAERDPASGAASTSRIDVAQIPEPAASARLAAALLALAGLAVRRRGSALADA